MEAVRTKRTVMQAQIETTAGTMINTGWGATHAIPIYDAFNVIQAEIETNQMNRARATLDPESMWVGVPIYRLNGNIYVFGPGGGNYDNTTIIAPKWSRILLQCAGFTETFDTDHYTYAPVSSGHKSATICAWLDRHLHVATGCRGNIVFSADVGQPVVGAFDIQGVYNAVGVSIDNPTGGPNDGFTAIADVASDPGIPPRLCGIDTFKILMEGQTQVVQPSLKSFSLDLGAQVTQRRNANKDTCLEEVGIWQEFNPRLTVTIEVAKYYGNSSPDDVFNLLGTTGAIKDIIEAMNQGKKFAFELNVGHRAASGGGDDAETWTFKNFDESTIATATAFRAQLARAPVYGDQDGIRTYELEFLLGGTNNNFLKIITI